jgi:hypothetical protein
MLQSNCSNRKNPKNMNSFIKKILSKKTIVIAFIILFISLIIKNYRSNEVSLIPTNKNQENSIVIGNLYRNTKYNFRIKFPEGWDITDGDGPNVVQKAYKDNRSINIIIKEFSSGVDSKLLINDIYSLEDIKDEVISSYGSDARVLDAGETFLDNKPVLWVKYAMTYSALDVKVEGTFTQYYLLHNKILYLITAGSTSDDFNKAEAEFTKTISTFVIEDYQNTPDDQKESIGSWNEYYLDQDKYKISLPSDPKENTKSISVLNILMPYVEYHSSTDGVDYYSSFIDGEALFKKELQIVKESDEYKNNSFTQKLITDRKGVEYPTLLDAYDELFKNRVGVREIEKIKNHFNDYYTIDYLWKNSNESHFIKGKIIIVDGKDIYFLSAESDSDTFQEFEKFVYSWKPFGELSE